MHTSFLEYTYTLSLSDRSTYVFTIIQNFINTTFKNTSHMTCHFHIYFIICSLKTSYLRTRAQLFHHFHHLQVHFQLDPIAQVQRLDG